MGRLGGSTTVAAVIGSPIGHSRSPAMHNAAFGATGLDWIYLAFDVSAERAVDVVRGAASLGFRGLSVTMPLKGAVIQGLDRVMPTAAALGAVNTITFEGGNAIGDNTDGQGLLSSLAAHRWDAAGQSVVVIGAGGAARAVVLALGGAGAASVAVVNRDPARGAAVAALGGPAGRMGTAADIADATLLINATPVGMADTPSAGQLPCDASLLHDALVVVDLVYHPLRTPLLDAARAAGATPVDGLGMLVHQAGLQFERWTGLPAPIAVMDAAARVD